MDTCTVVAAGRRVKFVCPEGGWPPSGLVDTYVGRPGDPVQGRGRRGACSPPCMVPRILPSYLWATGFGLTALPGLWGPAPASAWAGVLSR